MQKRPLGPLTSEKKCLTRSSALHTHLFQSTRSGWIPDTVKVLCHRLTAVFRTFRNALPVRGGGSDGPSITQETFLFLLMSWFRALLLAECVNRETLFGRSPTASGRSMSFDFGIAHHLAGRDSDLMAELSATARY